MPLLGQAAMALSFDVAPESIAEHDDWHTHEHFPERLSIPGFLRGTRWTALSGQPRYFVLYEVRDLDTLTSPAYLERLNNPTPWTRKIMPSYRGMARGFCSVSASFGAGTAHAGLVLRFRPAAGKDATLRDWLVKDGLPGLPSRSGLAGACLLESAVAPQGTNEQRIRGADAPVDWVMLVTGYSPDAVAALAAGELRSEALAQRGAAGITCGVYSLHYSLSAREVAAP